MKKKEVNFGNLVLLVLEVIFNYFYLKVVSISKNQFEAMLTHQN